MNEDLTKKIQPLQSRLTGSYFLEEQEIQINDDFTFETENGYTAFIDHRGNIIQNGTHYELIDWLDQNLRSSRSAIVNALATFLHLERSSTI